MTNFLSKVVASVLEKKPELSDCIFILPTQRAGIYLKNELKNQLHEVSFFPDIITFDHFVENITGVKKTNKIELLFEFYKTYLATTPSDKIDSFEVFCNWATTVLDDFNAIDNYLVDTKAIFNTLYDINKIQNWNPNTEFTINYLSFLQNLETYYTHFYSSLWENQKAYQGILYREAVEILEHFVQNTSKYYVFVGFGPIKKAESVIIQELLEVGKAEIYWDIPELFKKLYNNQKNFIDYYSENWNFYKNNPVHWNFENTISSETFEIIGVSKKVGMIKYMGSLLQKETNYEEIALVLADQKTLPTVLQSLPESISTANITMGLPIKTFSFSSLMMQFFELHISQLSSKSGFYYKNVFKILNHPLIVKLDKNIPVVLENLISNNSVYIESAEIISAFKNLPHNFKIALSQLFLPFENDAFTGFIDWLNLFVIALKDYTSEIDREVLFHFYKLHNQLTLTLSKFPYINSLKSLFRLYQQNINSENINFLGEPLKGLQIMGFLESQTLDFNRLILVSVNEGVLPNEKKIETFIPFDVKKYYGLPTYKDEELNSAYLFYRLIQRSEKITILYNTDNDSFGGGEKSRFVQQLLWEFPKIKHSVADALLPKETIKIEKIEKTPEVINHIKNKLQSSISPSILISYIWNPIDFYKKGVLNIDELDEIEETITEKTLGTVVHGVLENMYQPFLNRLIEKEELMNEKSNIRQHVSLVFKKEFPNGNISEGKNNLIFEVACDFVNRFINQEIEQLNNGHKIFVLGLELKLKETFEFQELNFPVTFKGIVDRIDLYDDVLRIIDYKTGKVETSHLKMSNFEKKSDNYQYSKVLQLMIYAGMVRKNADYSKYSSVQAGIISFKNLKKGFMPVSFLENNSADFDITEIRQNEFQNILQNLICEILNPEIDFVEKVN